MDLLHDAELVVTGGGATLLQALAQRKVCVAAPVAGDQPERIRLCAERGLVQPVELAAEAIGRAVAALLADRPRRLAMIRALRRSGVRNELRDAVAAIASLVEARAPSRAPPQNAAAAAQGSSLLPIR
jgi:UDP:flavonoid glycosyltransferase YjiC (YdhE family)